MTGAYPPSKETVDAFVARFDEATLRGNSMWSQEDMALMVRAYRYQAELIKGHQEDMRDAGREMRDLQSELNAAQRAAEGW